LRITDPTSFAAALLVGACATAPSTTREPTARTAVSGEASDSHSPLVSRSEPEFALAITFESPVDRGPCAPDMVLASTSHGDFCIDRFECSIDRRTPSGEQRPWPGNLPVDDLDEDIVAVSEPGRSPQGYISAVQAGLACEHAGKRLCTSAEWVDACRGPSSTLYPYGNERQADVCNDRFSGQALHPVVRLFQKFAPEGSDPKTMWTRAWLNDSRLHELSHTVVPTGSFPNCVSSAGAIDMVGNLHEWVSDSNGVFRGGFFMDTHQHGEGCEYRTTVHGPKYHDYSTGFRCCRDVEADASE
jgi:hypothetical protein